MKYLIVLLSAIVLANAEDTYPSKWSNMAETCVQKTVKQIGCEIRASLEYFKLATYFSRDDVNRPGFANFFFKSAGEEREHAIKLIEYLSMRGGARPGDTNGINELLANAGDCKIFDDIKGCFGSGVDALNCALTMEIAVTDAINELIRTCEEPNCSATTCPSKANKQGKVDNSKLNDFHLVDYLTGEFLEEQYNGQREIAGRLKTLEKMSSSHGQIGEFLFDKTLLE